MDEPIVLRLTLEHMQAQILQALYPREVELKERIETIMQSAINSFDFQAEIEREVASTLRNTIQRKVSYIVSDAINRQNGPNIEKIIQEEVERQLKEASG